MDLARDSRRLARDSRRLARESPDVDCEIHGPLAKPTGLTRDSPGVTRQYVAYQQRLDLSDAAVGRSGGGVLANSRCHAVATSVPRRQPAFLRYSRGR